MMELQPEIKTAKRQAPRIKIRGKEMIIAREDMMRGLGTNSQEFMDGVLRQLANAVSPGKDADEEAINFASQSSPVSSRRTNWKPCWQCRWWPSTWRR